MPIQEKIISLIERALDAAGIARDDIEIALEHPSDLKFGDYSANIALVIAKKLKEKPQALAQKILQALEGELAKHPEPAIKKLEVAGAGFINIHLSEAFFAESVKEILRAPADFGKGADLLKEKIIIEYTDPNAFKPLHIGHLMSNAIGESLSRLMEFQGAQVRRATYGSDVGLNVAMAVWGMQKLAAEVGKTLAELKKALLSELIAFVGKAYVFGATTYEKDAAVKEEIVQLNHKIYTHTDPAINEWYVLGKKASSEHFADMYRLLGSTFDHQFWESDIAAFGAEIVQVGLDRGIFEKSDGAVIYPGEKRAREHAEKKGLHNRVFITSRGIPTYEAKELGLTKKKFELHDFDESVVITANEQNDYFKVVMAALTELYPEVAKRTRHLGHGMMRFADGKMSSRTGNVITGEALLKDLAAKALEKMEDKDQKIAMQIAVAALKYAVLKQSVGHDIIFDLEQSISFEGDSGPYLQYGFVRTQALLAKAANEGLKPELGAALPTAINPVLAAQLYRFPEIIARASDDYAPQYLVTYLTALAGEFNRWYAGEKIIDATDKEASEAKLALVAAVGIILKNGLWLLAIPAPERM